MSIGFRFSNILDNYITYRITSIFYYCILVFLTYLSFEEGKNPILPNLIFFMSSFMIILIPSQAVQVIEPVYYTRKTLLTRFFMSCIPFILASFECFKLGRKLKRNQGELAFWLNLIILSILFGILSLNFFILILLIQISSTQTHAIYLLSVGMWMLIPIILVDAHIFYQSDLDLASGSKKNRTLSQYFQKIITGLYLTRNRRMLIYFLNFLALLLLVILHSNYGFKPISI